MCVVVYLANILVHSENPGEHNNHMRQVLRRLRRANSIFAKIEEFEFNVDTTILLGFVISPGGVRMGESRDGPVYLRLAGSTES